MLTALTLLILCSGYATFAHLWHGEFDSAALAAGATAGLSWITTLVP